MKYWKDTSIYTNVTDSNNFDFGSCCTNEQGDIPTYSMNEENTVHK